MDQVGYFERTENTLMFRPLWGAMEISSAVCTEAYDQNLNAKEFPRLIHFRQASEAVTILLLGNRSS